MADFITSKVDGDTVAASEWNQLASIDNFITTSGQTPATGNLNQMGIGSARYSSGGQFFTDSGIANAYVLSPVSPFKSPVSSGSGEGYFIGMTIRFRAGNANTGASTVNVNSAGIKNLKKEDGTTDLDAGDISITQDSIFRYDGTSFVLQTGSASETAKGIIEIATNAEVAAGTDTERAITAAALASLFNNSLRSSSGYIRIPVKVSGAFVEMIIQFGLSAITASDTNTTVTLPLTYPSTNLFGLATALNSDSSTTKDGVAQIVSLSTSQIVVRNNGVNASTTNFSIYWLSIGY